MSLNLLGDAHGAAKGLGGRAQLRGFRRGSQRTCTPAEHGVFWSLFFHNVIAPGNWSSRAFHNLNLMENVGLAFGLTIAAGAATMVGAAVPFFTSTTNKPVLAAALGLSAGVMLYVSFVEIFSKSKFAFHDLRCSEPDSGCGAGEQPSSLETTACFFAGVVLVIMLDFLVHFMQSWAAKKDAAQTDTARDPLLGDNSNNNNSTLYNEDGPSASSSSDSASHANGVGKGINSDDDADEQGTSVSFLRHPIQWIKDDWKGHHRSKHIVKSEEEIKGHDELQQVGLVTALAIAIHNLPEGLATFMATLDDPTVGASLAVAIAIHNIPEGVCIAMPVYHATGSRMKGFLLAAISGLSEPVGALVGYGVMVAVDDFYLMYGIMFGIVAGMMVFISIQQLLPTAHQFDPTDKYVSYGCVVGMAIMAASLLLFEI